MKLFYFLSILTLLFPNTSFSKESISLKDREIIFEALNKQGVIREHRTLVHLTHLCDLVIENKKYPVIDIAEYIKGAQVPRGDLNILVLNSDLNLVKKINYDRSISPLYCVGNKVFLYGDIMVDGLLPEGNILTFSEQGKKVVVSYMNPNDFPKQDKLQ